MINYTQEQKIIFELIKEGSGNILVNACAGSGKTTTIIQALNYIPKDKNVLLLAFNRHIAKELKNKIGSNADVMTLHTVGFNCLKYHYKEPIVDDEKYIKLINKVYKNISNKSEFLNIINIVRKRNLDENILKTDNEVFNYFQQFNISVNLDLLKKVFQVIKIGSFDLTSIDFIDMLYIPINKKLKTLWYNYVFVDECQDLNELQILLLKKLVNPISGRLICVGDPNQAIYAFNGADPESFHKLSYLCNNKLTLSKNYRCGIDIIKEAQKITPDINAGLAEKGKVVFEGDINNIEIGDWVLCRNLSPLIKLSQVLHKKDKPNYIKNFDLKKSLLLRKENKIYDESIIYELDNILKEIDDIDGLELNQNGIMLSTIHKVKGLENSVVHLIHKDLLTNDIQDINLLYVAITRAKDKFCYIPTYNFNYQKINI